MTHFKAFLFDMDGVMIDTESQYDEFWRKASLRYNIGIPNFEKIIKGNTLPNILKKYFSEYSKDEIVQLCADLDEMEETMHYPEIRGSVDFVKALKADGYLVGLVTSSTDTKLRGVYKEKHFDTLFDTIVSGNRVKSGKPDPECYLLAASDFKCLPEECVVFEDSMAGIDAGLSAGMTVVGLSTTYAESVVAAKGIYVIPDFDSFSIQKLMQLLK